MNGSGLLMFIAASFCNGAYHYYVRLVLPDDSIIVLEPQSDKLLYVAY